MLLLVLWSSFLVMWPSEGVMKDHSQDICLWDIIEELHVMNSSLHVEYLDKADVKETLTCLLYPTNVLNCSWSFLAEEDMQLSVYISVCDEKTMVQSSRQLPEDHVRSRSLDLQHNIMSHVIIQFNMSQHDKWTVYTYTYERDMLEVLTPPSNVSTAVKDGGLLVTWEPPNNKSKPICFEYQLDLDNQEPPKHLSSQLSYTEPSADPAFTYRVRLRARKHDNCIGSAQWSEWSPPVTVELTGQTDKVNILLIMISFGIPMILLTLVLLVSHQRVSKLLFPPIPRPPPKYIYFLQENEKFNFVHPMMQPVAEEEITKVEDKEENA